jgi:hypothetical protein
MRLVISVALLVLSGCATSASSQQAGGEAGFKLAAKALEAMFGSQKGGTTLPPEPMPEPQPGEVQRLVRCENGRAWRMVCPSWSATCYIERNDNSPLKAAVDRDVDEWCGRVVEVVK